MAGQTAWGQTVSVLNVSPQSITTTTETVIATLSGLNSSGPGVPITLVGAAVFVVQAATTSTTLRIRTGSVTGTLLGAAQVIGSAAGDVTGNDGSVSAQLTPNGEIANGTFVLTVQAAAAGANWNVTLAQLQAFQ